MDSLVLSILPDQLGIGAAAFLVLASFFTSALTASLGLGGGIALIAIMASLVPAAALVPVHGVVQFGSNAGRALVQIKHVDWLIALWFSIGACIGAAIGGSIAIELPPEVLKVGVACFVLWIVWGRAPQLGSARKQAMGAAGFVSTFLSMFFGAAGPIGGAVLSTLGLDRHAFVANQAVTALTMHLFKITAFGVLGFAFAPWLTLILSMIFAGFLGTLAGSKLLGKIDEKRFKSGFKWIMTILAANLLWQAVQTL